MSKVRNVQDLKLLGDNRKLIQYFTEARRKLDTLTEKLPHLRFVYQIVLQMSVAALIHYRQSEHEA